MDEQEERIIAMLDAGCSLEEVCRGLGIHRLAAQTGVSEGDIARMADQECDEEDTARLVDGWNERHPDQRTDRPNENEEELLEKSRQEAARFLEANGFDPARYDLDGVAYELSWFDGGEFTPALARRLAHDHPLGGPAAPELTYAEELLLADDRDPRDYDLDALNLAIATDEDSIICGDYSANLARFKLPSGRASHSRHHERKNAAVKAARGAEETK